ncbi:MAG: hypothetical protein AB7O98_07220 [Hyphomonadaceae bacterium]
MSIVLRHNALLELNVVDYRGAVTWAELRTLADFQAANVASLGRDCLNVIDPNADFDAISFDALDALFAHYRKLFAPLDFTIARRAAWVCQSQAAQAHMDYWLGGRDLREAMSSHVRQFASFAEAGDWLLLSAEELAAVLRGDGLTEIERFEAPLRLARAASA